MSKTKKRAIAIVLAAVLLIGAVVGGTIAWLVDTSDNNVVNTFTVGNIDIDLKESTYIPASQTLNEDVPTTANNNYKFVPGDTLPKDPFVTIEEDSEACWLFVKITDVNNNEDGSTITGLDGKIIEWDVDTSEGKWTEYAGKTGADGKSTFYYKKVDSKNQLQKFYILKGGESSNLNGQITVSKSITKAMVDQQTNGISALSPQLIFAAAAVQQANIADNVDTAWSKLPSNFTGESTGEV